MPTQSTVECDSQLRQFIADCEKKYPVLMSYPSVPELLAIAFRDGFCKGAEYCITRLGGE